MLPLILFLCLFGYNSGAIVRLNESEYARMPALVHLDPYEECLQKPDAVYCFAHFELVSDTDSPLLDMIKGYSDHYYTHFNHTRLRYGVCVTETCKDINGTHKDQKQDLEACLNETLWKSHRLKTKVTDKYYCNVHKRKIETGTWDTVITGVFVAIILANIVGSLYHYLYGDQEKSKVATYLLAFSVMSNWNKFKTIPQQTEPLLEKLQPIHGIRAIMSILVVMLHSGYPYHYLVPENPDYVEKAYDGVVNQLFFNGPLLMQTFFMLSGCLLIYTCLLYENHIRKLKWRTVPTLILSRLLRVTPPYAILLALLATWIRFIPAGPLFQFIVGNNSEFCRKNWWQHLLFINNYFDDSECMPHSWYLAADTQLYILGILVFVICKTPRLRNRVLTVMFGAGLIIPALHVYFQDIDATLVAHPESIVTLFKDHSHFNVLYKRGHTNLAGYTIGLSFGYLLFDWQKKGINAQTLHKYRYLFRVIWLFGILLIYSGSMFYEDRPSIPLYFKLLHASLLRPLFTFMVAVSVLGVVMKVTKLYNVILEWRPWLYGSRLSYGAYLIHMMYVRASSASISHTVFLTDELMLYICLKAVICTFALALIFWILVEAPVKILTHEFAKSSIKEVAEDSTDTEQKAAEDSQSSKKDN